MRKQQLTVNSRLLVDVEVSQRPTDRTLLEAIISRLAALPAPLGKIGEVLADAGYYSEANVEACERKNVTPYISVGRERHAGGLERFREPPEAPQFATARQRMQHR